jgi:hypothetical protein
LRLEFLVQNLIAQVTDDHLRARDESGDLLVSDTTFGVNYGRLGTRITSLSRSIKSQNRSRPSINPQQASPVKTVKTRSRAAAQYYRRDGSRLTRPLLRERTTSHGTGRAKRRVAIMVGWLEQVEVAVPRRAPCRC